MKGDFIPNGLLLQWEQQEMALQGRMGQSIPLIAYLMADKRKLFWGIHSQHLLNLKKEMNVLDKKYFVHMHDFKTKTDAIQFNEPLLDAEQKPVPNQQPIPKLKDGMVMADYNKEVGALMAKGITVR